MKRREAAQYKGSGGLEFCLVGGGSSGEGGWIVVAFSAETIALVPFLSILISIYVHFFTHSQW